MASLATERRQAQRGLAVHQVALRNLKRNELDGRVLLKPLEASNAMSRYYFHIEDGRLFPDEVGAELDGMKNVRSRALRAFTEMMEARAEDFWEEGALRIVVQDDRGLTLFTVEAYCTDAPAVH